MEKLLKTGKVKAIGVSNFSKAEIQRLVKNASVLPAVHQMECHPWLQQHEFTAWHRFKGIHVTHYSPFGNQNSMYAGKGGAGRLLDERVLAEIGQQYGRSPAQIALGERHAICLTITRSSLTMSRSLGNHAGPFRASKIQDASPD